MSSDLNQPQDQGPRKAKAASKDITPVLKGWDYEPGTIGVRRITGRDGRPKLQMRLDLGVLQMEVDGRPDGARPHGHDSLLDYFEQLLKEHERRNGTELGFHLSGDQCQSLREEAVQYYHRYLTLFVLEDFDGVVRDTERNLRLLDLCGKYAESEHDRMVLEQYRPYITMMNTRGRASVLMKANQYDKALEVIRAGLGDIKAFFARFGQLEAYGHASEVRLLKRFARQVRRKIPVDPVRKLENQLNRAVKAERYEEAARLRDEIALRRGPTRA